MMKSFRKIKPNTFMVTILWNLVIGALLIGAAEIVCRFVVTYDPSYYTSVDARGRDLVFPYGLVKMNSLGHPDDEFDLGDPRPRIAYVGDSVTWGVGAGHGHRFSDILERRLPGYQHMTLASIADGFRTRKRMDYVVEAASSLGATSVIYCYNLNDTLPDVVASLSRDPGPYKTARFSNKLSQAQQASVLPGLIDFARDHTEFLRNKSYLYNWVRFKLRIALLRFGIDYHGEQAYELFPDENRGVIAETAARITYLHDMLAERGIGFLVVLVPYEMQISADAADTYESMGIRWGPRFIDGRLQTLVTEHLEPKVRVLDAYPAFVEKPADREQIKVGELFVYDEGDSLDWNHPNREGHKKIAGFLERNPLFLETIGEAVSPQTK